MFNGMLLGVLSATPTLDLAPITEAITQSMSVGMIATVIGAILSAGVGFALFYWGARKIVGAAMHAFKTGKIKF